MLAAAQLPFSTWAGLPTSVIKIIPNRHAQSPISQMILDSVKVTELTIINGLLQEK